eukprot:TRINITY_DN754_c0_g1_i1.p1 TRINITY_DN754_c0_g1~~TRINITY_DN754_c0_g1_i1.p1  ORF type:complete len:513 (-),score=91.91 TRINITY_DN754_c0_g1_i1:193-1698(-)
MTSPSDFVEDDEFEEASMEKPLDPRFLIKNLDTGEVFEVLPDSLSVSISDPIAFRVRDDLAYDQTTQTIISTETPTQEVSGGFLSKLFGDTTSKATNTQHEIESEPDEYIQNRKVVNSVYVDSHHKMNVLELSNFRFIQRFDGSAGHIWACAFSPNGQYFATGGQDSILKIYEVIGKDDPLPTQTYNYVDQHPDTLMRFEREHNDRPVLHPISIDYKAHSGDIIDICWSESTFLLTASLDHTVRLFHPDRSSQLAVFKHRDFVTGIAFCPSDDRFFVSVCLDGRVRKWNIQSRRVVAWADPHALPTALAWHGNIIAVGCHNGKVFFYQSDDLQFITSLECRSRRGKRSRGSKVTGIRFLGDNGDRVAVSTNDSRIRMYTLEDYLQVKKYKGHTNEMSQLGLIVTDSNSHIISGSECGHLFIWPVSPNYVPSLNPKWIKWRSDHSESYEVFRAIPKECSISQIAVANNNVLKRVFGRVGVNCEFFIVVVCDSCGMIRVFANS